MPNKNFLIWAGVAAVVVYFWETSQAASPTIAGVAQVYNLGYNFGKSGTFSLS